MTTHWLPRYVLRRLLLLVPIAFLVSLVVFSLTELVPGGVIAAKLGGHPTSQVAIDAIVKKYHLNDPWYQQYWTWLRGVLFHFDFGRSIISTQTVTSAISARIGITLILLVSSMLIALLIGVSVGVMAAMRRGRPVDRALVSANIVASSAPPFVVSILGLYVFGLKLGWVPIFGAGSSALGDRAHHLVLPAFILGLSGSALIMRITRAAMLEQVGQDYVTFAKARGLARRRIVLAYTLRNALIPVLTAAGLLLIGVTTGTVFVESVFGLPGLGQLLVTSVQQGDVPVIQALVMLAAGWIVLLNILVDILYALIDPRVRFERVRE